MKTEILCVGKIKEGWIKKGVDELAKRMRPLLTLSITELKDASPEKETQQIINWLDKKTCATVFVLAEEGAQITSQQLAHAFQHQGRDFVFIVGGPEGLSNKIKQRADVLLSLSKMTFLHEMARVILLEQIYRAQMIRKGRAYHK